MYTCMSSVGTTLPEGASSLNIASVHYFAENGASYFMNMVWYGPKASQNSVF